MYRHMQISFAVFMSFIGVTTILSYGSDLTADEINPFPVIRKVDTILHGDGSGRVKVTSVVPDRLAAVLEVEAGHGFMSLQDYGMKPEKSVILSSNEGRTAILEVGRFSNIFDLLKFIDSSVPFRLTAQHHFSITWDGELLELISSWPGAQPTEVESTIEFRFSTTGFVINEKSTGRVSADRKSLIFELSDIKDDRLVLSLRRDTGQARKRGQVGQDRK